MKCKSVAVQCSASHREVITITTKRTHRIFDITLHVTLVSSNLCGGESPQRFELLAPLLRRPAYKIIYIPLNQIIRARLRSPHPQRVSSPMLCIRNLTCAGTSLTCSDFQRCSLVAFSKYARLYLFLPQQRRLSIHFSQHFRVITPNERANPPPVSGACISIRRVRSSPVCGAEGFRACKSILCHCLRRHVRA